MKQSYLVQRLQKPFNFKVNGKTVDNPFCFGGGMKNGGLSDKAMDMIRNIFSFDYMGAAEFEFGAVPKALQMIAKKASEGKLIAHVQTVSFKYHSWKKGNDTAGKGTVYILCTEEEKETIVHRIKAWAMGNPPLEKSEWSDEKHRMNTKERVGLDGSLANDEYGKKNCGWLELDNGYMFFTDKEMFDKTAELFGVAVTV